MFEISDIVFWDKPQEGVVLHRVAIPYPIERRCLDKGDRIEVWGSCKFATDVCNNVRALVYRCFDLDMGNDYIWETFRFNAIKQAFRGEYCIIHPDHVELSPAKPQTCSCPINVLMTSGCRCGGV